MMPSRFSSLIRISVSCVTCSVWILIKILANSTFLMGKISDQFSLSQTCFYFQIWVDWVGRMFEHCLFKILHKYLKDVVCSNVLCSEQFSKIHNFVPNWQYRWIFFKHEAWGVCYQNLIRICIKISAIKGLLSKWFTLRTYLSFHEVRKWEINWICLSFL